MSMEAKTKAEEIARPAEELTEEQSEQAQGGAAVDYFRTAQAGGWDKPAAVDAVTLNYTRGQ